MPRRTVTPDLDRFRPPGFDLKRYDRELTAEEWHRAMLRRSVVLQHLEEWSYADPGVYAGSYSTDRLARLYLPEIFGEYQKRDDPPEVSELSKNMVGFVAAKERDASCFVKDLSTMTALSIFNLMREHEALVRTGDCIRAGNTDWVFDPEKAGTITPAQWAEPLFASFEPERKSRSIMLPIEVNLHAPDSELAAAFSRWLAAAREAYGVPEPRPAVLNKPKQNPVITRKMLYDWQRDRVLAFLDLYLWNRIHNPPPCEGLWSKATPGRFFHHGRTWTLMEQTWLMLVWGDRQYPNGKIFRGERVFRQDVLGKAIDLIAPEIVNLLGAFAQGNRTKSRSSRRSKSGQKPEEFLSG